MVRRVTCLVYLALTCAAATQTGAQRSASRWATVDSTAEYVLSVDRESAHTVRPAMREVWFQRVWMTPRVDTASDGTRRVYVREAWLYRFDCEGRKMSHRERILYGPSGSAVRTMDFADPGLAELHFTDMKAVAPESGGEVLWKAGCALKL